MLYDLINILHKLIKSKVINRFISEKCLTHSSENALLRVGFNEFFLLKYNWNRFQPTKLLSIKT